MLEAVCIAGITAIRLKRCNLQLLKPGAQTRHHATVRFTAWSLPPSLPVQDLSAAAGQTPAATKKFYTGREIGEDQAVNLTVACCCAVSKQRKLLLEKVSHQRMTLVLAVAVCCHVSH